MPFININYSIKKFSKKLILTFIIFYFFHYKSYTQDSNNTFNNEYYYEIIPTNVPIKIDGKLEEDIWKKVQVIDSFYQCFPYDTSYSRLKTEVRLTYDEQNLYISAVCFEALKGEYVIQSLKRDFSYSKSDVFAVYLDPLGDKTNGFNFSVSPLGVQREGLIENGGGFGVTTSWDNKWFSEVSINDSSWICEIKIPFKTIRYKPNNQSWRINFSRQCLKINENSSWVPVPRMLNIASLGYMGELHWKTPPPKTGLNMGLIPYFIMRYIENTGSSRTFKQNTELSGGFDAKIGLTPALFMDVTFNPDFAQVEVDRQITNLDRFELFFPERRLFFIENSDLFANFGFSRIRPFFSRRIGLYKQQSITIPFGVRVSGKLNTNWRIGAMNISTEGIRNESLNAQNYSVLALQRQVFKASNIGFIFANRQGMYRFNKNLEDYTRVIGIDYNILSQNNRWRGKVFYHHLLTPTLKTQNGAHAAWLNYQHPNIRISYNHEYVEKNYNPDIGYVPRRNMFRSEHHIDGFLYPKSNLINKHGPTFTIDQYLAINWSKFTDSKISTGYKIYFQNTSILGIAYDEYYTRLFFRWDPTNTNGKQLDIAEYYYRNINLSFDSNYRKKFYYILRTNYGSYFNGLRFSYSAEINYRIQPIAILTLNYERNEIILPSPYATAYLNLISPRFEFSFTRELFFTLFLQYNTQIERMNVNARFQWRFKPMSDLFIVLTDNYFATTNIQQTMILNRAIIIKFNYWFGL